MLDSVSCTEHAWALDCCLCSYLLPFLDLDGASGWSCDHLLHCCSKDARAKDATASDKLKAAKAGDQDAKRLEEEAAKLGERSRAAQEKAERTEKEAHSHRTGLSGIQGDAKSKRQAAER